MAFKLPTDGSIPQGVNGHSYWHKNWKTNVRIVRVSEDDHGVWYHYVADDGREGECFAELLLVRNEEAAALGFESDDAMHVHQKWLETHGTPEYHAWASQFRTTVS